MWNSVFSTCTIFIGGKKIYMLCRKDISNTDIFPVLAGGGGDTSRRKKQYKKNILHDFHSGVLSAHSVSGWDFSLAQPESCISTNGVW
jgi:hypothetical protein